MVATLRFVPGLALALVLALAPSAARADGPHVVKGPYLQSLDESSVEIRAELDTPAPLVVTLGGPPGEAGAPRELRDPVAGTMHVVRVGGLMPSTYYSYSVRAGADIQKGQFTTAPADDSKEPFTFLVYGDNRTDDVAHAAIVKALAQTPGDFLVNTGDFVQDGAVSPLWQTFFDIEKPLLRDRALFACVGNHELVDGAGANYLRYFGPTTDARTAAAPAGSDGSSGAGGPPRLYGSVRWASARFFLLDAMESFDYGPERAWLDDELTRADTEPGLAWRVVVTHQAPWSSGPHGGNPRMLRAGIPALFARHKVDLVIAGHDHIYERGYAAGIRYLISGGGGAPLYPVRELVPTARKAESVHHFVEATVRPDSFAMVARRDDGSVLERCAFTKASAAWDCDPPPAPASPAGAPGERASSSGSSSRCACTVPGLPGASPLADPSALAAAVSLVALARARRRRRSSAQPG